MAGAIYVPLKTVFDDSGLRKAQSQITSIGKSLKGALAGVGVATSLGAVVQQLDAAARAAAQDAKSQLVLANSLRNVAGASNVAIASSEQFIQKLQMQVGIADDQLRPVFSRLVAVTGDLTKSQGLLALAADLAASKNIDLSTAGNALAKAVGGQTTALFRLAPELKNSSDWMATLKQNTAGAASTAANADPFQRLTVIFGEMQEQIGYALLPAMQKIANFIASEEFQGAFTQLATDFANIVTGIEVVAEAVGNAITDINNWLGQFGINFDISGLLQKLFPFLSGLNSILSILKALGLAKNEVASGADETSRLMRRRLESLGAIGSPIDLKKPKAPNNTINKQIAIQEALAKAAKEARDATQKLWDSQVSAWQEATKAADEIMASTDGVLKGFTDLFRIVPKMGAFEGAIVDGFKSIYDTINSALADKRILQSASDALTAFADKSISAMQAIGRQRDVLAQKIDIAKSVTSGVMGMIDVAGLSQDGNILDNFRSIVAKAKAFGANIVSLKKLGLNKNLFADLVNAGADAAGATTQAIVDGGMDSIEALNQLYADLNQTASDLASETTDILYEVGQQIMSTGFVGGLMSQDETLRAAAATLADSFAESFKAQLKAALTVVTAPLVPQVQMSTIGIGGGFTGLLNQMGFFGSGVASGSSNTLTAPQSVINLYLNAQGTGISGTTLAQQMITEIKKYERNNGAVWVAAG